MRRTERLFRLVNELRTRGVSRAQDLAAYLEICTRTAYRDIAHLQASGLPIEGEAGVGYNLRPGFDLPALTFTYEQLDAVAVGLSFAEAAGDLSLSQAAPEVRAKLQASLPEPNKRNLENAPMFASRRDGQAASEMRIVRRAIREAKVLRLQYRDAEGRTSERRVQPLAIWAFTDGWLFAGWCDIATTFALSVSTGFQRSKKPASGLQIDRAKICRPTSGPKTWLRKPLRERRFPTPNDLCLPNRSATFCLAGYCPLVCHRAAR